LPFTPLTITEVEVEPSPRLGSSRIYLCAAAGTALGILFGVAVASSSWLPGWLSEAGRTAKLGVPVLTPVPHGQPPVRGAEAAIQPSGPKDFGSLNAISAGLKGHLVANFTDRPTYRLVLEPADPAQRAGFALAVTSSPHPLSVGFQLIDSTGAVLCGQDVVVRFDAARAAALNAAGGVGAAGAGASLQSVEQLEAQEMARERGRDVFENEIGDGGQIAALNAEGAIPCSPQAYQSAASWSFSANFPSVSEQAEMVKREADTAASQKPPPAHKLDTTKKPEAHKVTAALEEFDLPKGAGR
jgi:hypothetical protein